MNRIRKREDYSKKNNLNLNELLNYGLLTNNLKFTEQIDRIYFNFKNMVSGIDKKNGYHRIGDVDKFKAYTLSLITEAINLLLNLKVSKDDFEKHIERLNAMINEKYPV